MKRRLIVRSGFILLLVILISATAFSKQEAVDEPAQKSLFKEDIFNQLELYADAVTLINANYVKEVEPKDLIYGSLDGMLSSLDSHSSFLDPDEYQEIKTETRGEFGGLGIKITLRDKVLTVVTPLEGTPADEVGILPGDKILEIDDEPTKDFTLDDAVKLLRGIPGTDVKLTILREDDDELKEFVIKRAIIKIKSVKDVLILQDRIGYIRMIEFQRYTAADFKKATKKLLKQKMDALILDLRNNPGGLLEAAIQVSEQFLRKGDIIVSTEGRIEEQNAVFKSRSIRPYLDFPIVVLINKGSASGSEIVAAALGDNKRAVVLGETSFGKGSVQTVIPMRDGSALRLTTSLYMTPLGEIIHEKGVVPDIEVIYKKAEEEGAEEDIQKYKKQKKEPVTEILKKDNQVQAAVELLKDNEKYESIITGKTDERA